MDTWFTVEKLDDDTFAISEYRHWEEPHCYLVRGTKRAALIDTGLGIANIQELVGWLTDLPVMVLTSHVHWDHIGGHKYFDSIAVHEAEKDWLSGQFPLPLQVVKRSLTCHPCDFPEDFRLDEYQIFQGQPQMLFRDGDSFSLGGRTIRVIHTPGHSPGHCCFYEPERGYLYSGDLIYRGCLDAFYPSTDPALFWQSVQTVQALPVCRLFPGHHSLSVSVDLISQVENAFHSLASEGKLRHGGGIFDFGSFQIHL